MAFNIDFLESYDLDSIAAELRRIAASTGKQTVSARDIDRFGRIHARTVTTKFGTLRNANKAAGLDAPSLRKWTDDELLKVVTDLWTAKLKESCRSPIMSDVKKYGFPLSAYTISNRFGTWKKALVAANNASGPGTPEHSEKAVRSRKWISPRKRFVVFKRDLYTCRICRRSGVELVLDHVIPVSRGGLNTMENLQTLCVICNQGKGGDLQ